MERFRGIQFGPDFQRRYRKQQAFLSRREPRYYWTRGDYSGADGSSNYSGIAVFYMKPDYDVWDSNSTERHSVTELMGIEEHFRDRIDTLLKQKTSGGPVMCMDLGGFRGLSWARLANHFQQEVRDGKVVFITTALSKTSEPKPVKGSRIQLGDLTVDEVALLKTVKREGLVQELFGTVADVKRATVNVNRQDVPVRGNIDILYESVSLTSWSKIPDLEILQAGKLLSDLGAYYIREVDSQTLQPSVGRGVTYAEEQQRLRGIELAFGQLENLYGLRRVRVAEEGKYKGVPLTYCLFRKPNAPRVRADN